MGVTVEGLRKLSRNVSKLDGGLADLKGSMTRIAAFVIDRSRPRTPVRSGRLERSFRPGRAKGQAIVRNFAVYSAVIEFGWPKRNIAPRRMVTDTVDENTEELVKFVRIELEILTEKYWRAL